MSGLRDLAHSGMVERLIKKICPMLSPDLQSDLRQDIFLSLLEKDAAIINNMCNNGEIEWFLIMMIKNNYYSKSSPFYRNYRKFSALTEEINWDDDDDEDKE